MNPVRDELRMHTIDDMIGHVPIPNNIVDIVIKIEVREDIKSLVTDSYFRVRDAAWRKAFYGR